MHTMEPNHHFLDAVLVSCKDSPAVQHVFDLLNGVTERRLLLACSGGADSVFLLHVMLAYAATKPTSIVLAHYNHAWRPEADEDAQFVVSLAKSWNLPIAVEKNRRAHGLHFSETSAREFRLDFLRRKAQEYRCPWIAFGHQMNDILETQLLRLARGAGVAGLAAPRPLHEFKNHPDHLRPLLGMKADAIRSMLKTAGISWQEDCSNQDVSIQRNALRNRVVPEMSLLYDRDLLEGAAKSRERFQEDAEALECWTLDIYKSVKVSPYCLSIVQLSTVPAAIIRRCLYLWLSEHLDMKKLRPQSTEAVLQAIVRKKEAFSRSLGKYLLVIEGDSLRLITGTAQSEKQVTNYPLSLAVGGKISWAQGQVISAELVDLAPNDLERILAGRVNCAREVFLQIADEDSLVIRSWQPGDRYTPLGCSGSKKLKACFREQKLSILERSTLPIVTLSGATIVWVPYLPPADNFKLDTQSKSALRLTYELSKAT